MACALRDGHEILAQFLFMIFLKGESQSWIANERTDDLLHIPNKRNSTLLSLTLQHKGTTMIPVQLLLKMEKDYHRNNLSEVTKCFKKHLKPSLEVWQALNEIEESYPKDQFRILMIYISTFIFAMLWPTFVLAFDVGSDYYLLDEYSTSTFNNDTSSSLFACNVKKENHCNRTSSFANNEALCLVPQALSPISRFYYLLVFILIPHLLYSLEFLQSLDFRAQVERFGKMCSSNQSWWQKIKCIPWVLIMAPLLLLKMVLWPFYMIWKAFVSEAKAATSSGEDYFRLTRYKDETLILQARSRIIEACTEASFQPMLVLYMALPDIIQIFTQAEEERCGEGSVILKWQQIVYELLINPQIISIFGSIVSLVLSFDMYYEAQKRGALGLAGNFYGRLIRLASTLLLVVSRLLALVLCAYCFGEGMFYPLVLLVIAHIFLMSFIHYATSYEWKLVEASQTKRETIIGTRRLIEGEMQRLNMETKTGMKTTWLGKFEMNMIIVYQCLINGIGNIYLHNWIVNYHSREGPAQQMKTTFLRQIIIDLIFATENIVVVAMVLSSTHSYLQNLPRSILIMILVFHFFGVVLKIVYYYAWHMWAYSFDVVMVDYNKRYPQVSFSIPYYCCGKKDVWKIGSRTNSNFTDYINRPTVDVIFNRQSIGKTPGVAIKNTADYIHMNSLRTATEKRLINAIMEASNASLAVESGKSNTNLEPTAPPQKDFTQLRSLFDEYINELEMDGKNNNSRESSESSFKFSEKDIVRFDDESNDDGEHINDNNFAERY